MTTETTETVSQRARGTVYYSFKLPLKQYMTAEASIFMPYEAGADEAETIKNANDAFFAAKSLVASQLGLEFELDVDVVRILFEKNFGPTTEITDASNPTVVAPPAQQQDATPSGYQLVIEHQWEKQPVPDWLYKAAAAAGVTRVKDVRRFLPVNGGNGKPSSPWFKAADGTKDDKGVYDLGFWPPRD